MLLESPLAAAAAVASGFTESTAPDDDRLVTVCSAAILAGSRQLATVISPADGLLLLRRSVPDDRLLLRDRGLASPAPPTTLDKLSEKKN